MSLSSACFNPEKKIAYTPVITIIPIHESVTIVPAISTPARTAGNVYRQRMPKTKATAQAVHAPVTGRGIATKGTSPKAPYFSILLL
jgi:hypothetical protein